MSALKQQMNIWEQKYHDIMELYRLNEELLATVETAADPEAQFALVEPLVETVGATSDVLTEEYIAFCDAGPMDAKRDKTRSGRRVEMALRNVYSAMREFHARVRDQKNAALMVVKKLKRQLEQVIAHFVEFTTLNLDRMMQKQDVEDIKTRHANIALMLGQLGHGA